MIPRIPKRISVWKSQMTKLSLKLSLHNLSLQTQKCESGSQVTHEQFLVLRTIWPNSRYADAFKIHCENEGWITCDVLNMAKTYLEGLQSWKCYEESFSPPMNKVMGHGTVEGSFALVRYYQHLSSIQIESSSYQPKIEFSPRRLRSHGQKARPPVTPTPSPKRPETTDEDIINNEMSELNLSNDSPLSQISEHSPISGDGAMLYRAIEDEAIVNTALVLFLNGLTLHCEDSQGYWSLRRHPFIVRDAITNDKIYEARVDGLLRLHQGQQPAAIMEVKPFLRYGDKNAFKLIKMQESAQMAAWIAANPPAPLKPNAKKHRRLLVSQDHQEIYLTIATFGDDYVNYIRGQNMEPNDDAFLSMQEFGPFGVNELNHMTQLARILLGVSIQGGLA